MDAKATERRRTWVFPNGRTLGLAAVLAAMCYAGVSQNNGAAYLLCFFLVALAMVSLAHAWANLDGVAVGIGQVPPIFAHQDVPLQFTLNDSKGRRHFAVQLAARRACWSEGIIVPRGDSVQLKAGFHGEKRGHYRTLQVELSSDYPLGFFTARQRLLLAREYDVYPEPKGDAPMPRSRQPTRQPSEGAAGEGDDFGGVRLWRPGESQRHIDWKAAARNEQLLTKQWTGDLDEVLRFDWGTLAGLEVEDRLSQLAKWVLLAERGCETYALQLPGKFISAGRGDRHFHQCLKALAGFRPA